MPITLWEDKYYDTITLPSGTYAVDNREGVWLQETQNQLGDEQEVIDQVGDTIIDHLRNQPPGLYASFYAVDDFWDVETNLIMPTGKQP